MTLPSKKKQANSAISTDKNGGIRIKQMPPKGRVKGSVAQ